MALKSSDFFLTVVPMMVPGGAEGCQFGRRELFVTLGTLAGVLVNKMGTFEKNVAIVPTKTAFPPTVGG